MRQTIETRLNTLLYTVAGIALVVGAIGIANTTLVSVLERTQEFGLRRAFGARPRHIITHVVGEAAALGAIGGAIGASLGLLVLTAIAITQQWTLTIEPAVLPAGPLIGALTGAIAGTLPANRARHIEPAEALRR